MITNFRTLAGLKFARASFKPVNEGHPFASDGGIWMVMDRLLNQRSQPDDLTIEFNILQITTKLGTAAKFSDQHKLRRDCQVHDRQRFAPDLLLDVLRIVDRDVIRDQDTQLIDG